GPFTDVAADAFCPFVLEIFTLGITTGTTATTFDPASNVSRLQMAAFLSRTVDGVLQRGSRRIAMKRFWTPQSLQSLAITTLGSAVKPQSDGANVWVAAGSTVMRVHASDGRVLQQWTGADTPRDILLVTGKAIVTSAAIGGKLYQIDPRVPSNLGMTLVDDFLGGEAVSIAFDGARIWTANQNPGSVSIVTPGPSVPWTVT